MLTTIDVTLRDGGYRNNFSFPEEYARTHAELSARAGLEWVEIAYRNGSFKPIPGIGPSGRGEDDYIRAFADLIGPDRVGMILHPKNVDPTDLDRMYRAGARLVRICLNAAEFGAGVDTVRRAKDLGFTVAVNFTRVTQQDRRQLVHAAAEVADLGTDVIYLADSNGSLTPDETRRLITSVGHVVPSAIGLHAHNNLGLALANSIAAVEAGATWIDASVLGMGKGPGNLATEQWLAYLTRRDAGTGYDLGTSLALAERLAASVAESTPELPLPDLLLGWFDLAVEHRAELDGHQIADQFAAAAVLAHAVPVA
ncbi:4-hydroxy 2-oxovalerate aldolase [Kitasatospora sp. MMS16-BH015]|uniref:3-hydroxy-3-methylglutaryl-CoA lyase n=1 Tax=Kitasatospora sp. MMS16-BH015 TaxID=2018025 RepID=UPI000CA3C5D2|nr:3-hydroxy-3-methylglutaryl-CoA lyase [Kitasatospora sp. MMS16-BH015]AUG78465.1 4-hydroxy 2-oxovalerate aldolase [Kitasatospora sp. MMS16-BH015]